MSIKRKLMNSIPSETWVRNLRKGNIVWLVKEEKVAEIAYPYEIEPGHVAGDVGVRIAPGHIQKWFIRANGNGLDNKPLIHPIEGEVPENPPELPSNDIRRLYREMERLTNEVYKLRRALQNVIDPSGIISLDSVADRYYETFGRSPR